MSGYPTYKPSGVEWLGDIPAYWEVKRLKDFAKVENGKDYKHVEVEEGGFPVYGSGGEFRRSSEYIYNKPSVLLGRKGTIDKPLLVTEPFWTVDTMFYTKINSGVDYRFFYYLCKTIQFDMFTYGSALPSMTQNNLHTMIFCRPILPEQTAIANYLDEKTGKIDQLVSNLENQIDRL
ncbi:MAG: type I restriction enzyme S subunit, partial [Bacteroidia bacterium]